MVGDMTFVSPVGRPSQYFHGHDAFMGLAAHCVVVDEPFYACYLLESGADHPMRDDIIASQPKTRGAVVDALSAQSSVALQYEKHMTHHMPRGVDLSPEV